MKRVTSSRPFVKALHHVAKEQNAVQAVSSELKAIRKLFIDNPDFRQLLLTPMIDKEVKKQIVRRALTASVSSIMIGFLEAVIDKHAVSYLEAMADQFAKIVDKEEGRVEAVVTTAIEMAPKTVEALAKTLNAYMKKDVVIKTNVDPGIGGGIIVRLDDKLLDGSVQTQLSKLRSRLTS